MQLQRAKKQKTRSQSVKHIVFMLIELTVLHFQCKDGQYVFNSLSVLTLLHL